MINKKILNLAFFLFACTIAFGQIGPLTPINNGDVIGYTMNKGKGALSNGSDGMEITFTTYGNIMVRYKGVYQMYSGTQSGNGNEFIPTSPTNTPSQTSGSNTSYNGVAVYRGVSTGTTSAAKMQNLYYGGRVMDTDNSGNYGIVFPTPSIIPYSSGNVQRVTMSFSLSFGTGTAQVNIPYSLTYEYTYPETRVKVTYNVTNVAAPNGTILPISIAQGWDTYLSGGDYGPGFYKTNGTKDAIMVQKNGAFEAFIYESGQKWSGYYSAYYSAVGASALIKTNKFMMYDNTVDANANTDNAIGISVQFPAVAGNYQSASYISFLCGAGDTTPPGNNFSPNLGDGTTGVINLACGSAPGATVAVKHTAVLSPNIVVYITDNSGNVITPDATQTYNLPVGTYKYYYYDNDNLCSSPVGIFTVSTTCVPCYKNPTTTTGGLNPIAAVSTILNRNATANWQNSYKGADMVIESKAGGFVLNRLTQVQITAIPAANLVEGMTVYNITTNKINIYVVDGANTGWKAFDVQSCQ